VPGRAKPGSARNKGARAVKVADEDLNPELLGLLRGVRDELEPYGWSVHIEKSGRHMSVEFRNPLSPVSTGMVFDPSQPVSEVKQELAVHVSDEPEFAHTKLALAPRRKRQLIGGIRWAATSYGWSRKVFLEVIDTLRVFSALSEDEWQWLKTVGPDVLRDDLKREWRQHMKADERRRKAEPGERSKTTQSSK